ncbi:MAG: hypothetical protein HZA81_03135 [Candidatus Taylorbacteria bacterium]|nr:hypothetical protein [Candidatus Taylorbacteria bacterium]
MKSVVSFLAMAFIAFTPLRAALSDSSPKSVPIKDLATLKAYAISKVNWLSGGVAGQSVSGTYWFSVAYSVADGDPVAIAAALKKNKVTFSADPTETLAAFANWEIRSPDGTAWTAFYGDRDFKLVKDQAGAYQVPPDAGKLDDMEMGTIPFPVKGISNAKIVLKDDRGNTTGVYYFGDYGRVRDGYLLLSAEHVAQNGDLYLEYSDGSLAIYSASTGMQKAVGSASTGGFDTAVRGVRTVADNSVEIKYAASDDIVRAKYTADATVAVKFDTAIPLPLKVTVVEESAFKADPYTPGISFDPAKVQVSFKASAGKLYLILFSKTAPAIYSGGKG